MKKHNGFTIVELLIVIVVIAILAAISIVAYNGVQARSIDTAAQTSVKSSGSVIENFNAVNGKYPSVAELSSLDMRVSKNNFYTIIGYSGGSPVYIKNYLYCLSSDGTVFAIIALGKGTSAYRYVSNQGGLGVYNTGGGWTSLDSMCQPIVGSGYTYAWGFTNGAWQSWTGV